MVKEYGVVDLFAGPGGLAEGFSKVKLSNDSRPFKIELSAEKESSAHQTLRLRSFLRQFPDGYPDEYYEALNLGREQPDWASTKYRPEWDRAEQEALPLELGTPEAAEIMDRRITELRRRYHGNLILVGGPPCQAYSLVGRARNRGIANYVATEDKRHYLYREYIRILKRLQPAVFVMENVKGILSSTLEDRKVFDMVLDDLQSVQNDEGGYQLIALSGERKKRSSKDRPSNADFVVRAEDYGVPQARHRVIVVGVRKDILASPLYSGLLKKNPERATVEDVIGFMPALRSGLSRSPNTDALWRQALHEAMIRVRNVVTGSAIRERMDHLIVEFEDRPIPPQKKLHQDGDARAKAGKLGDWLWDSPHLFALPNHEARGHMRSDLARYFYASVFSSIHGRSPKASDYPLELAPDHQNWNSGKFADRFRVQALDRPSSTVTSHISKDGHYFIHPDPLQCRSLTVREAARLQTFPDDYIFLGNRTEQFVQVGNAVPPFLANQIAEQLFALLTNDLEISSSRMDSMFQETLTLL